MCPFARPAGIQRALEGCRVAFVLGLAPANRFFNLSQLPDFAGDAEVFAVRYQVTLVFVLGCTGRRDGVQHLLPGAVDRTLELLFPLGHIDFRTGFADFVQLALFLHFARRLHAAQRNAYGVLLVDGMPFQAVLARPERHITPRVALQCKEVRLGVEAAALVANAYAAGQHRESYSVGAGGVLAVPVFPQRLGHERLGATGYLQQLVPFVYRGNAEIGRAKAARAAVELAVGGAHGLLVVVAALGGGATAYVLAEPNLEAHLNRSVVIVDQAVVVLARRDGRLARGVVMVLDKSARHLFRGFLFGGIAIAGTGRTLGIRTGRLVTIGGIVLSHFLEVVDHLLHAEHVVIVVASACNKVQREKECS